MHAHLVIKNVRSAVDGIKTVHLALKGFNLLRINAFQHLNFSKESVAQKI